MNPNTLNPKIRNEHKKMYKRLIRKIIVRSVFGALIIFLLIKCLPDPEVLEKSCGYVSAIRPYNTNSGNTYCYIDTDKWTGLGPFYYSEVSNMMSKKVTYRIENDFIVKKYLYVIGEERITPHTSTIRFGIGSLNDRALDQM